MTVVVGFFTDKAGTLLNTVDDTGNTGMVGTDGTEFAVARVY